MQDAPEGVERIAVFGGVSGANFGRDYLGVTNLLGACKMTTPFRALEPFQPRIVDIPYAATTLPCKDCTDCSDTTDSTDVTDVTDSDEI